jgi:hypothetical protein
VAAAIPFSERLNAVTVRGGKSTRDQPHPNHAEKATRPHEEDEEPSKHDDSEDPEEETPQKFIDTSFLPFPTRKRKTTVDEQFARFVEMIQKIHVNVLLLDVMHVPTYARYIKDIINNKRPLPTAEVVRLTEDVAQLYSINPQKEPTTTHSKRRQSKKMWRKVESLSSSSSPGRANQW